MMPMKIRCLTAVAILISIPIMISAADIWNLIPSRSGQVLKIDLGGGSSGSNLVRQDLIRNFFRQAGVDEKKNQPGLLCELAERIVIVTPVLTEDSTLVFVQTKVPEAEFCKKLTELLGVRPASVQAGSRTVHRIVLPRSNAPFPGIPPAERVIAFSFLGNRLAVFAKDSLAGYWGCKQYGLPPAKRQFFLKNKSLAAGFFEPDADFLQNVPLFPPFRTAFYSMDLLPDGALRIRASAECPDDKSADQVQMQIQQYVMVGGVLLNQSVPELAPEWMNMFQVRRNGTSISLAADVSAAFIARLSEVSEKMAGNLNPGTGSPGGKGSGD